MRFNRFPDVWGDDLYVDAQFLPHEKEVLPTTPLVVCTPRTVRDLLYVMNRVYRGNRELRSLHLVDAKDRTTARVARQLARSVEGLASLLDAALYAFLVVWGRTTAARSGPRWEHDLSSRLIDEAAPPTGEE